MKRCAAHKWTLPDDMECPDCLWDQACEGYSSAGSRVAQMNMVTRAIINCVKLMPSPELAARIAHIAQHENRWKALKEARIIHHAQGDRR